MRRWILTAVAIPTAFCLFAGGALFLWVKAELDTPYFAASEPEIYIDITRGSNTSQIANLLVTSGVLHSRTPFILYLRYRGLGHRIQAGEYRFTHAATPRRIAQRLIKGDVYYRSITVPEGLTANETIELLAEKGFGDPAEMKKLLLRTDWIKEWDPTARNLEGYLFPETYRFGRKVESETVLQTMVDQFRSNMERILKAHPLPPGWNVSSIVVLASMIEKEVKDAEEGPIVASVLVNRLREKIPLSCDATIIYAMKLAGTYEGNLTKNDLKMDSPYNTYIHPDLPPGPISNPGASSIRAALEPAETQYLYYVSRNDGTHQFSEDLSSHNQAVNQYQKSILGRNRSKE